MPGSFITALSGLRGASAAIDAIGNNLANLNTVGFKASGVSFQDVVAAVTGASSHQIGSGVASPQVLKQFVQGSIQTTRGSADAAIQGDGFFVVRAADSGSSASISDPTTSLYTRAGNFRIDQTGILVTATGERVQGWSLNTLTGQLNTSDPIGDIVVPVGTNRAARATTSINANLNLDASATTGSTFAVPFNIYDSLGNAHVISATFTKQATVNTWNASISSTDPTVTAIAPSGPWVFKFNTSGGLDTVSGTGYNATTGDIEGIGLTLTNGAVIPLKVNWSPWQVVPAGTPLVGVGRLSQFAQPSASSSIFQNGLPAAQLVNVSVGDGGAVLAQYSNGSQQEVARLTLASVRNPDTLVSAGNNNYRTGVGTAIPVVGIAATGGRGTIVGGALESSNVDIAEEFTKLIIYQRAYSANARVITTTDEISQETINLKR